MDGAGGRIYLPICCGGRLAFRPTEVRAWTSRRTMPCVPSGAGTCAAPGPGRSCGPLLGVWRPSGRRLRRIRSSNRLPYKIPFYPRDLRGGLLCVGVSSGRAPGGALGVVGQHFRLPRHLRFKGRTALCAGAYCCSSCHFLFPPFSALIFGLLFDKMEAASGGRSLTTSGVLRFRLPVLGRRGSLIYLLRLLMQSTISASDIPLASSQSINRLSSLLVMLSMPSLPPAKIFCPPLLEDVYIVTRLS